MSSHKAPLRSAVVPTRRRKWLVAGLLGMAVIYLALLPWRRHMGAEVVRLEREAAAREREERRLTDLRGALTKAQEDVVRSPGDADAHVRLAAQYHSVGRLEDAAQQAEIASGLQPRNSAPLLMLADIQQHARRYTAAIRAYRAALVRQPDSLQATVGLSYLYIMFGWPQEAEAALEPAIRANPQNPQTKVALALAYSQQSHYKEAERLLQQARQLAPQNAALWTPLVHLYNENHRFAEAIAVGRDALALTPQNVALMNEIGQSHYHLNAYPEALQAFARALALSPDDISAHYYQGLCFQRQNQPERAIAELEFVLRHQPSFEQTRQILGILYMRSHRVVEGQRLLAEAKTAATTSQKHIRAGYLVAGQPRSAAAHWQMAQIYLEESDNPRAVVELDKTLELDPHQEQARSLLERLQPEKARMP